jgi:tetratricopeptide (TPR) repeat protein
MIKPCRRLLGLVVGCTVVLALLLSGCSGMLSQVSERFEKGRRAQISYNDGLELYQAKDYARAIPQFERALAFQPDFDDAEAYLAWSYYHIGKYPQATRHFLQVISRQPRWEGLHNGLGWSRYRLGRYHLAIEAFQEALDLDPRYREAVVGLAYSLFELGRYAEALPHLERLTREGEGHALQSPTQDVEEVRSRFAWALYYVGQYGRAREEFTKGIAARPSWFGLHNGLGWTLLKLGDRANARASFQRAVKLKSDFTDAREGLAQAKR